LASVRQLRREARNVTSLREGTQSTIEVTQHGGAEKEEVEGGEYPKTLEVGQTDKGGG